MYVLPGPAESRTRENFGLNANYESLHKANVYRAYLQFESGQ